MNQILQQQPLIPGIKFELNEYNCINAQLIKDFFLKLDKSHEENAEEFKGVFLNRYHSDSSRFIKLE